jgi:hypothetical protein
MSVDGVKDWPEKAEDWHARTGSSARFRLPDFPEHERHAEGLGI